MRAAYRAGVARTLAEHSLASEQVFTGDGARESLLSLADQSVSYSPRDPATHSARAVILSYVGRDLEAREAARTAAALRPCDYLLWLRYGQALEHAGDAGGAEASFRQAQRRAPHYARPAWSLGNLLLREGRLDEAFDEMRNAAESNPSLFPALVNTVWRATGGDTEIVLKTARPRSPSELLTLAQFLIKNGEVDKAMRLYRESGQKLPEEEQSRLLADLLAARRFALAYEVWSGEERGGKGDEVRDGGFEGALRTDETGFGWQFERDTQTVRFSLDATDAREGGQSLRADYEGNSNPSAAVVSQIVLAESGARYRLSFSARTKDFVSGGLPYVEVVAAGTKGDAALASSEPFSSDKSAWQDYVVEFTVPSGAEAVRISLKRRACTTSPCPAFGAVLLDRFELKRL
jgi:tetratricopeptide (TPR) repeat protein